MVSNLFNIQIAVSADSLAERFSKASLNTVIGMLTVFSVLILISFLISSFKYIPAIVDKFSKKKDSDNELVTSNDIDTSNSKEEYINEDINDEELVAVITAAIYASMKETSKQLPLDGLVVRSIKRVNTKWARP